MHRKKLIEKLEAYIPEDRAMKEKFLLFVKTEPLCFERSLEEGHVTASSWLVSRDFSKALLMLHAKLGIWVQPGGHCDGDPDVLSVAIKEAQEESGIQAIEPLSEKIFDIDIHFIPASAKQKGHLHYDVRFLLHVASDERVFQNSESLRLEWFGKDLKELPTQNPSIVRMHEKWTSSHWDLKARSPNL